MEREEGDIPRKLIWLYSPCYYILAEEIRCYEYGFCIQYMEELLEYIITIIWLEAEVT